MRIKKVFRYIYFIGLILLPIVLLILPADFFDTGDSVCLSVMILDQECPGCGMTRGVQHLLHLDFMTAYQFNKLSLVVLPLLIYLWVKETLRIKRALFKRSEK